MTWKFLTVCVRLYVPIDENDFMIFCRLEAVARAGAAKMGRPEAGTKNKKFWYSLKCHVPINIFKMTSTLIPSFPVDNPTKSPNVTCLTGGESGYRSTLPDSNTYPRTSNARVARSRPTRHEKMTWHAIEVRVHCICTGYRYPAKLNLFWSTGPGPTVSGLPRCGSWFV